MGTGHPPGSIDDPTGRPDSRIKHIKTPGEATALFAREIFNLARQRNLPVPTETASGSPFGLPVNDVQLAGDRTGAVRQPRPRLNDGGLSESAATVTKDKTGNNYTVVDGRNQVSHYSYERDRRGNQVLVSAVTPEGTFTSP